MLPIRLSSNFVCADKRPFVILSAPHYHPFNFLSGHQLQTLCLVNLTCLQGFIPMSYSLGNIAFLDILFLPATLVSLLSLCPLQTLPIHFSTHIAIIYLPTHQPPLFIHCTL